MWKFVFGVLVGAALYHEWVWAYLEDQPAPDEARECGMTYMDVYEYMTCNLPAGHEGRHGRVTIQDVRSN